MRILFVLMVFSALALASENSTGISSDTPDGLQPVLSPAPVFSSSDNANPGEVFESPVAFRIRPSEGSSVWPESDWSNDVLVYPGAVGSGQDWDIDQDTNDLYAILDSDHATNDSCNVYRSQDGGVTWNFWRASYNTSAEMNMPKLRVVKNASGATRVCMFFLVGTQLRMRWMTPDQSSSAWETVADNVSYYDVDGEVGTGGWVYVTYVPAGTTDVRFARNALTGGGFVDDVLLFSNAQVTPYPTVAAGYGGTVSVSFTDTRLTTNTEVRIKHSTNYGSTFAGSAQVSNNSSGASLVWTDMAYSHGATQTGWIFVTFDFGSYDNLGYYYSTNSGTTWTYGAVMPGSNDENLPSIRTSKITGSPTLAFNSDPGDSTMFSWASLATPTNFTTPVKVNDYQSTGYWPPAAGWNNNYSGVLYTSFSAGYKLYFDWFGNTPVEEETSLAISAGSAITISPNPVTDIAAISFSTLQPGNVSLSVYDSAGRLIDTLVDEPLAGGEHSINWSATSDLTPGVYFCVMTADGQTHNQRIVLIK